jgi:ATP-dependent Clp protease protease subunit
MNKFWKWEVKNEADGGEQRVLRLEGVLAEDSWFDDDVTPEAFREELESGSGDISLHISSPGGDCVAASRIYTMLRDYAGKVFVQVDGLAASAASVVAMAGDRVLMSPTALMMIHNPMTVAAGDTDDMRAAIKLLDEVKESIINAYETKTGLTRDEIARLMDKETWMDAHRAVELGFADGILFENEDAAQPAAEAEEEEEPEEDPEEKPEDAAEEDPEEEAGEDPEEEEEPEDLSPLAAARIEGFRVAAMLCERSALASLTNRAAKKKPAPEPEPEPEPEPAPEEKKGGPVTLNSAEPQRRRRAHTAEKAPVGAECLAGRPGDNEMAEQRELIANQYANMKTEGKAMSNLTNEARGAFFRSRMTGSELPAEIKNALTFTKGGNPGGPLLPVEVSTQLITDIYGEDRFLQYLTHTQIKGLRLPKISATPDTDAVKMPDGSTGAAAYTLADAVVSFGRYPGREKILVPGAIMRGTDTDLNAYITKRMTEQHRAFMRSRIFLHGSSGAAPSAGDFTHMSVYGTTSANGDMCITAVTTAQASTDPTGAEILAAIQAAIAALPEGVRDEAKVVMPYADWQLMISTLANGAATLYGAPAKTVLGFEVVICDSCVRANGYLVGDLSTLHVNYDDPLRLETDRDINLDMDLTVIGYDYDIRCEDANRLRLAKLAP